MLTTARAKGAELGCVPGAPGRGAALAALAAAAGAKAVVEIGTGAGVGSLWLLRGMRPDGVLTTIDVEPEHHRAARETLAEAGIASNRVRLISGRALDVLPRLTDAAYDLVFCDADKKEYAGYLEQALRLLRPGGHRGLRQRALARPGGRPDRARRGHHGDPRPGPRRARGRAAGERHARRRRRPAGRRHEAARR